MADALITADRHTSTNLLQLGTLVILADILYNAGHGLLSLKVAKVLFCLPFRGFKLLHGAFCVGFETKKCVAQGLVPPPSPSPSPTSQIKSHQNRESKETQ